MGKDEIDTDFTSEQVIFQSDGIIVARHAKAKSEGWITITDKRIIYEREKKLNVIISPGSFEIPKGNIIKIRYKKMGNFLIRIFASPKLHIEFKDSNNKKKKYYLMASTILTKLTSKENKKRKAQLDKEMAEAINNFAKA